MKRNNYLNKEMVIYDRWKSKRMFTDSMKDITFKQNLISSLNTIFEERGIDKQISEMGNRQEVICLGVDRYFSNMKENMPSFFHYFYVLFTSGIIVLIGEYGKAIVFNPDVIIGSFMSLTSSYNKKVLDFLTVIGESINFLSLENKRAGIKFRKLPKFKDTLDNVFYIKEENIEFTRKLKKSLGELEKGIKDIDIINTKVNRKFENFQVLKNPLVKNGFSIERVKTGDKFFIIKKK